MSDSESMEEVDRLLERASRGDTSAYGELFAVPAVAAELKAIALGQMKQERPNHTLQATALVNEAYMRIRRLTRIQWRDNKHFRGAVAHTFRRILIDHARSRPSKKHVTLHTDIPADPTVDAGDLNEALDELAELDERQAKIVELKYFAGMTMQEIADYLEMSKRTVEGDWTMARTWLKDRLGND